MAERYGTDLTGLGGYEGGVNSENGAALVSTSSDGETSLLFGSAALREIQAGVANGDFAISPDDSTGTITAENPLPYWTFTDASSGIIVPTLVASASTAMGHALRFTIAATTTGKIGTFTRYIPIAGNANRIYSYIGQLYRVAVSGTAGDKALVKVTLTLTSYSTDLTAGSASATANYTANSATPTLTTSAFTPDATAAFILVALKVETTGTTSGTVTIDFSEVRTARGDSLIPITDDANPTWLPALITASSGTLTITAPTNNAGTWTDAVTVKAPNFNRGLYVSEGMSTTSTGTNTLFFGDNLSNDTIKILAQNTAASQNYTGDVYSSGVRILGWQGNTIAGAAVTPKVFIYQDTVLSDTKKITSSNATPPSITLSGASLTLQQGSASGDIIFKTSAGATIFTINNASNLVLETTGGYRQITPPTTTQTSSAAIWVNTSGTTWELRRNSSSARYKTNIVDADEVVLEAARKVKPRHYESTIEDEAGATRLGFIAEEIHEAGLTHAVGYDSEGKPETIDPVALIAALWHRVSDLEDRLKALEAE